MYHFKGIGHPFLSPGSQQVISVIFRNGYSSPIHPYQGFFWTYGYLLPHDPGSFDISTDEIGTTKKYFEGINLCAPGPLLFRDFPGVF
jgi:hypothetical protein